MSDNTREAQRTMTEHQHRNGFVLQPLEDRTLFAGLTVIAHGIEPEGERAAWLDTMADAIVAHAGNDAAVYALHVAPTEDPEFFDLTLEWINGASGTAAADSDSAEIILLVDWADVSDPSAAGATVSDVGFFVSEYLFETDAELGIDYAWGELPIHLIGHGRGAGVVSEIAWYAGNHGLWIDHLTFLDPPAPDLYPDEQPAAVYENVFFADAYFQTSADQKGSPVTGAVNHDLSNDVTTHAGLHQWYLDTITSGGGGIGYDFSRLAGAQRDPLGIGENFTPTGLAPREVGERIDAQYPNVGLVTITDPDATILQGDPLSFTFLFQDHDSDGEVEYYLDQDTNPYNDNSIFLAAGLCQSAGDQINLFTATVSTADVPSGTHHLFIFVTDADGQVRYAYADAPVTLLAQTPTIGSLSRSAARVRDGEELTLTANDVSSDALTVRFAHDTDGNGAYDPAIDQSLFIDTDGSDGWSFTGRIKHLSPGVNRFFAIATDADGTDSAPVTTTVTRDVRDEYENNDTRSAARNLGFQTALTAYPRLNLLDDNKDWFRFRLASSADRGHAIKISYKEDLGRLSLKLYDADGRRLRAGAHSLNKEVISLNKLPKGTYYARITGDAHPKYKLMFDPPAASKTTTSATTPTMAVALDLSTTSTLFNSTRRILRATDGLL